MLKVVIFHSYVTFAEAIQNQSKSWNRLNWDQFPQLNMASVAMFGPVLSHSISASLLSHGGSMVLLYMVLHGSRQYTPFMLAFFYQHHGSVMGNEHRNQLVV